MKDRIKVFFDSDAVISSLLSRKGTSYILTKKDRLVRFISNLSNKELLKTTKKLNIPVFNLNVHIKKNFNQIIIKESIKEIKRKYYDYTSDENDAHIVGGAVKSRAKFVVTFNKKHYSENKIKNSLGISIMTPGEFLQYLRSQENPKGN